MFCGHICYLIPIVVFDKVIQIGHLARPQREEQCHDAGGIYKQQQEQQQLLGEEEEPTPATTSAPLTPLVPPPSLVAFVERVTAPCVSKKYLLPSSSSFSSSSDTVS